MALVCNTITYFLSTQKVNIKLNLSGHITPFTQCPGQEYIFAQKSTDVYMVTATLNS